VKPSGGHVLLDQVSVHSQTKPKGERGIALGITALQGWWHKQPSDDTQRIRQG